MGSIFERGRTATETPAETSTEAPAETQKHLQKPRKNPAETSAETPQKQMAETHSPSNFYIKKYKKRGGAPYTLGRLVDRKLR